MKLPPLARIFVSVLALLAVLAAVGLWVYWFEVQPPQLLQKAAAFVAVAALAPWEWLAPAYCDLPSRYLDDACLFALIVTLPFGLVIGTAGFILLLLPLLALIYVCAWLLYRSPPRESGLSAFLERIFDFR